MPAALWDGGDGCGVRISPEQPDLKPDPRLFQLALDGMAVAAENALYVGNHMCHGIYGAREATEFLLKLDSMEVLC